MSRPMNFHELQSLLEYIADFHSPDTVKAGYKVVKYAHPAIDIRHQECFAITVGGSGWYRGFVDEESLEESLFDRVLSFLRNHKETFQIQIIDYETYDIIKTFNCETAKEADKVDRGFQIKLDHDKFFTKIVYLKEGVKK